MKLYATIESERASKGQGGNDYLNIELFYGTAKESKLLATLKVKPVNDGYGLYLDGAMIRHSEQIEKAKRQKGECMKGCAYHTKNDSCTDLPS